jgi:hypothetical protein
VVEPSPGCIASPSSEIYEIYSILLDAHDNLPPRPTRVEPLERGANTFICERVDTVNGDGELGALVAVGEEVEEGLKEARLSGEVDTVVAESEQEGVSGEASK